jgi:hypothetical protein
MSALRGTLFLILWSCIWASRASAFQLRPAKVHDAKAIATLHTVNWNKTKAYWDKDANVKDMETTFLKNLKTWQSRLTSRAKNQYLLVVEAKNQSIAGFISAYFSYQGKNETMIGALLIRSGFQSVNLGRMLISAVAAASPPSEALSVYILKKDANTQAFYARMGAVIEVYRSQMGGYSLHKPVLKGTWDAQSKLKLLMGPS